MEVRNKIAIVTGSGQGLGKAFSIKLLEAGAKVCLSDVNQDIGKATFEELSKKYGDKKVHFIKCDVTNEDQFKDLYEGCERHFGGSVKILINNAGVNTKFGWKKCMDINIIGVMNGTELAMEKMSKLKGGKGGLIINTASSAGIVTPRMKALDNESAADAIRSGYSYTVSKHTVVALTRSLGVKSISAVHGIEVKALCPLWVDTEMVSSGDPKFTGAVSKLVEKTGLMKPDYVAGCMMKVITECSNGTVLAITKDGTFNVPNTTTIYTLATVVVNKLASKMIGGGILQVWHQVACMGILLFIVHLVFGYFIF